VPAIDSEQQRIGQEIEAARLSRLFASPNIRELAPPAAQPASVDASSTVPNQTVQPTGDDAFAQNGQDRKLAFVNASGSILQGHHEVARLQCRAVDDLRPLL
jgi:type IV secretion system protein TrbI